MSQVLCDSLTRTKTKLDKEQNEDLFTLPQHFISNGHQVEQMGGISNKERLRRRRRSFLIQISFFMDYVQIYMVGMKVEEGTYLECVRWQSYCLSLHPFPLPLHLAYLSPRVFWQPNFCVIYILVFISVTIFFSSISSTLD